MSQNDPSAPVLDHANQDKVTVSRVGLSTAIAALFEAAETFDMQGDEDAARGLRQIGLTLGQEALGLRR